jgi:predicted DNA-binding transcriptional regulator YafY
METTNLINRLKSIDYFIRRQATGNAHELSKKLEITERSVYNYLRMMKKMGAPIVFSVFYKSYIYENNGGFFIGYLEDLQRETAGVKSQT